MLTCTTVSILLALLVLALPSYLRWRILLWYPLTHVNWPSFTVGDTKFLTLSQSWWLFCLLWIYIQVVFFSSHFHHLVFLRTQLQCNQLLLNILCSTANHVLSNWSFSFSLSSNNLGFDISQLTLNLIFLKIKKIPILKLWCFTVPIFWSSVLNFINREF